MDRVGRVVELIDQSTAKVLMQKHTDCGKCGACGLGRDMDITTLADNNVAANVGDMVEMTMETKNILSAAFIMYTIPLITLLLGIFIGSKVFASNTEGLSLILGFAFLVITYFLIKKNEKKYIKKYKAVITKVI